MDKRDEFLRKIDELMKANRRGDAASSAAKAGTVAVVDAIVNGAITTLADEAAFVAAVQATLLVKDELGAWGNG